MEQNCYEVVFKVTETCSNGKERAFKKSVLSPIFRESGFHRIYITEETRVEKGIAVLKEMKYYNIEYIETKLKTLLWTE